MIHGPDLSELVVEAKAAVMRHFVTLAENADGVPPTLRAMYLRKAAEAQVVRQGGTSALIAEEAELRGLTPLAMANLVLSMAAGGGDELELKRMRTNVLLESATDEQEIVQILAGVGCTLSL